MKLFKYKHLKTWSQKKLIGKKNSLNRKYLSLNSIIDYCSAYNIPLSQETKDVIKNRLENYYKCLWQIDAMIGKNIGYNKGQKITDMVEHLRYDFNTEIEDIKRDYPKEHEIEVEQPNWFKKLISIKKT